MLVRVSNGQATIQAPDGVIHQVPYEPLDEAAMVLQARYHQFIRAHAWRRKLHCARCQQEMEPDQWLNETDDSWEVLMVCQCRAIYGKLALSKLPSPDPS